MDKHPIDSIPRDGEFWKSGTRETLISKYEQLKEKFPDGEAYSIIEDIFFAAADEYGD
ncbi:MAG: hypothetical protein KAS32_16715 [Candidatus Peribacteraceae bacterium]|nr:hypothetical protein [Candidatus Peribacteraceae bacterium]